MTEDLQRQINQLNADKLYLMQQIDIMRDERQMLIDALAQIGLTVQGALGVYDGTNVDEYTNSVALKTMTDEEKDGLEYWSKLNND